MEEKRTDNLHGNLQRIENEISQSYWEYAWFTICDRSLPSVFDGLKPVHRRILYAMWKHGFKRPNPTKKCSNTVGFVMADFHPHGDQPVYQALVRMAQDFVMRIPLIDSQGNFGSIDGDGPAAMRYTEARLSLFSHEFFEDWDKDTVDVVPNYDGSLTEPVVLPTRVPNLLINGSAGISVGISTSIPSHNLGEVIDGLLSVLDNPEISFEELFTLIKGPDFATGGTILGIDRIWNAYKTGEGTIIVLGKYFFEGENIVFYEIPYQTNKADIVKKLVEGMNEGKIQASVIRDESGRDGLRIFIKVKQNSQKEIVLNQVFLYSQLKSTYRICLFALNKEGKPHLYNLKEMLSNFLSFRDEVLIKRTKYELNEYRRRVHILIGLGVAIENIEKIVALIRSSNNSEEAKGKLKAELWDSLKIREYLASVGFTKFEEKYRFSDEQIKSICEMRLQNLVKLEKDKVEEELLSLRKKIEVCNEILNSPERRKEIIREDLIRIKGKYNSPRRTDIEDGVISNDEKSLVAREDVVFMISKEGYIKRLPLSIYRSQKRGGKGRGSYNSISIVKLANTHDTVLFFSNSGLVYGMYAYQIPTGDHVSKGRAIINLLPLEKDDEIYDCLVVTDKDLDDKASKGIMFVTSNGNVRKNNLTDFANLRSNGKKYMMFEAGEKLIDVSLCSDNQYLFIATQLGKAVLTPISQFRTFKSRDSNGVRGCRLSPTDKVVSAIILDSTNDPLLFTVTENGYGKITKFSEYRITKRGAGGVINITANKRNGKVVKTMLIEDGDKVLLNTQNGSSILFNSSEVRTCSRYAMGVRLFTLDKNDIIICAERVKKDNGVDEDEETSSEEAIDTPENNNS